MDTFLRSMLQPPGEKARQHPVSGWPITGSDKLSMAISGA